jgi:nucleoid-associated protein YgaU
MQDTLMTETYDDEDYPEYDDYPSGGRVLWGRFAFWGFMLLFFFILGRISAPSAVSEADFNALRAENMDLSEQVQRLRNELEAQAAGGTQAEEGAEAEGAEGEGDANGTAGGEGDGDTADQTSSAPEGSRTYVVENGDTLNGIAQKMYGDTNRSSLIVQANGLNREFPLQVGQELIIPPAE